MDKIIEKQKEVKPKNYQTKKIMFRQNRKFDLHIGRNVITFRGREIKGIPRDWLKHKDFQNVKKYFSIKEG